MHCTYSPFMSVFTFINFDSLEFLHNLIFYSFLSFVILSISRDDIYYVQSVSDPSLPN